MTINAIVENMGMTLMRCTATEDLIVGDPLELWRADEKVEEATLMGIIVAGKLRDRAAVGEVADCLLRGKAATLAAVGDELRKV